MEYTSEVVAVEPRTYLEIELKGGGLGAGPMRVAYRLSADGGRTTLYCSSDWQPHGLMPKLMSPLIALMSRRNSRTCLERLKVPAES